MSRISRVSVLAVLFLCLAVAHAPAVPVTINYDGTGFDFPTQIGGYYSALAGGPVHSAGFMWLDYQGAVDSVYGPHSLTAMSFAMLDNPVRVDWSAPVGNVSFWYGFYFPLSVEGYLGGNLVFSSGALPQNSGGMFQYIAPNASIDRLVFNGSPDYWTMDDLSYNTSGGESTVPEPASMVLLGTGLAGLRAWRKRRG